MEPETPGRGHAIIDPHLPHTLTAGPETRDALPSEDIDLDQLDEAMLVLVVGPDGIVRIWVQDPAENVEHAYLLREVAERLDPS